MSATPQRGRRRAESAPRSAIFGATATRTTARTSSHAAVRTVAIPGVSKTAKCMAAVAVVGSLFAAGAIAQQANGLSSQQNLSAVSSVAGASSAPDATSAPVQAPADAAIAFPGLTVTSSASPKSPESIKVEADAVKAVESPKAVNDPAAAQAYAAAQLGSFGWGADQMSCLTQLWQRESEWLTSAENASSGAYGIAQSLPASKMESTGSDWATNYETQIRWGMGYIQERYGSPCGAWGHSNSVGWY